MASEMLDARALGLPDGSHLSTYADQERRFAGLIRIVRDVDAGTFESEGSEK